MARPAVLVIVAATLIPIAVYAQPAPAKMHDAKLDCTHEATCLAAKFADALSAHAGQPLRLSSLLVFAPGSTRVYSKDREKIMALAAWWRDHLRWTTITVEGYADARNTALARQRAGKIRDYLIRYGVAAEYVVAKPHDHDPDDSPGRQASLGRVDLTIASCEPTSERCRTTWLAGAPGPVAE
jgi:OmpA family protein